MSEGKKAPEFIQVERLLEAPVNISTPFQLPDSAGPCCR